VNTAVLNCIFLINQKGRSMKKVLIVLIIFLIRGSTFAQGDSVYITSGTISLRFLASEIGISFNPLLNPFTVDVSEQQPELLNEFRLSQNYPNPFNPQTNIKCVLPASGAVRVKIFDINGRLITEIFSGEKNQGEHIFTWDGRNALGVQSASGTYLFNVSFNNAQLTKKIIYLK
jgi:hypothetical protein